MNLTDGANVGAIIPHKVGVQVYSLSLPQCATVTLFARSAIVNLTKLLTVQISALSLKHADKSNRTVRSHVYSLWLAQSVTVTLLSSRRSDRTADGANVGAIIKTRPHKVPAQVYSLWLVQSATVTLGQQS